MRPLTKAEIIKVLEGLPDVTIKAMPMHDLAYCLQRLGRSGRGTRDELVQRILKAIKDEGVTRP